MLCQERMKYSADITAGSLKVPESRAVADLLRNEVKDRALIMSKYPVADEVIATNRPAPWRGARIDFTSVLTSGVDTTATPVGFPDR